MTDGFRERRWHAADDVPLYLRDYGNPMDSRVPVLCLSGLTRTSADFHGVARRLAGSGRRVLAPDYRGRGASGRVRDWRRYAPPGLIEDLLALLAAFNLHRVVVIGTSLGGLLAMGLAVARPTAVAAAVLGDIGPEVNPGGLDRIIDFIGRDRPEPDWTAAAAEMKRRFPTLGMTTEEDWLRLAYGTYCREPDGLLHFNWDVRLVRTLRGGAARMPDLWPLFGALARVPTLVVRGGVSDVLTAEGVARMVAVKPDLRTLVVPGVGHAPTLDEPACREAIDALLAAA